jgi:hypothetical protein
MGEIRAKVIPQGERIVLWRSREQHGDAAASLSPCSNWAYLVWLSARTGMAWSMSNKQTRTPHPDRSQHSSAAVDRGRAGDAAWRGGADAALGGPAAMAAEVELAMSDLVGDANGEVVFFNDSGLRRLSIATDATVVANGRAAAHRTAAGQDVSGFRFLTFDNGLTLYYESGLDVVVRDAR